MLHEWQDVAIATVTNHTPYRSRLTPFIARAVMVHAKPFHLTVTNVAPSLTLLNEALILTVRYSICAPTVTILSAIDRILRVRSIITPIYFSPPFRISKAPPARAFGIRQGHGSPIHRAST